MIKKKKDVVLDIPAKMDNIDTWLVVGLDPSLSSTGFAVMEVKPEVLAPHGFTGRTLAAWRTAGSVRPETAADPIWVRSKMIGIYLRELVANLALQYDASRTGLILSMEFPTPMDDFLVSLNRIMHLTLFETNMWRQFAHVRVLMTNAATLRSLMGLFKKGNNKAENIARAYDFIDKNTFPQLDSDACDAVLLGMMGRHVASILLGHPDELPSNFKTSLCNAEKGTKGAGRNIKVITKGILHRPEYWYQYERRQYALKIRDASSLKKQLNRQEFTV